MNRRKKLRIIPHSSSGGWAIIGAGNKKPARVVQTLNEALDFASRFAPQRYGRISLHPVATSSRVNVLLGRCNSRGEKVQ